LENLLPPIPEHLATLGMFDGQLGMATLGFIVEPDITPRFPAEGALEVEHWRGFVDEETLHALVEGISAEVATVEAQDLSGFLAPQTLTGAVQTTQDGLEAMVSSDRETATVTEDEDHAALVSELDFAAELAECDLEALINDDDDDLIASIEEAPGEGRCRR